MRIGICLSAIVDLPAAQRALAIEYGGLEIPPEQFGGKATVGQRFKLKDKPWLEGTYDISLHEKVNTNLLETDQFNKRCKCVLGAVTTVQVLCSLGHEIIVVSGFKTTPEPFVTNFWRGNNLPQHIKREFVRGTGKTKQDIYETCDVVIERDLKHLVPLSDTSLTLLRLLPGTRDVGSEVIWPQAGTNVADVRGWRAMRTQLERLELAA